MAIEPLVKRDPEHPCPICGADTELVSQTLTSWNDHKHQVVVTPDRRRCSDLKCRGHLGLDERADS
jgi:hypothetical protein